MTLPPDDISKLLAKYLDDRDSLTDEQYGVLVEALRDQPLEIAKLKDQLIMEEKLGQLMAADRADFSAQVAQRLRDLDYTGNDLQRQVQEMRALADADHRPPPQRPSRRGFWVLAACLLLAVGAGVFFVLPGLQDRPQAVRVFGAAALIRDNQQSPLVAGERLRYGDRIVTLPRAYAELQYPDGTRVNIAAESVLHVLSKFRSGKILEINRGAVASSVAAQPSGRPMRFFTPRADAKVVGTELLLEVTADQTRLNVGHGKVELRGLSSRDPILVARREYAVSDGGEAEVQALQWPSSRERLEVLLEPERESPPASWELRGNTLWDNGLRLRRGAAVLPAADAQAVTEACRRSNQLTVELLFRFSSTRLTGPARIVSLSSDPFTRNFTLGQEEGYLIFRLRTPATGENGTNPEVRLCRIDDRQLHHLAVTYRQGKLNCYLDGEHVSQTSQIAGDFSNWTEHYLTLGDEWSGDSNVSWRGEIRALAVYSRALEAREVLRNMAAMP